ncbi:hypothetical protein [Desulfurobacterium sp.]
MAVVKAVKIVKGRVIEVVIGKEKCGLYAVPDEYLRENLGILWVHPKGRKASVGHVTRREMSDFLRLTNKLERYFIEETVASRLAEATGCDSDRGALTWRLDQTLERLKREAEKFRLLVAICI